MKLIPEPPTRHSSGHGDTVPLTLTLTLSIEEDMVEYHSERKILENGGKMKIKINTLCMLIFFGAMFFQVQPGFSVTSNNIAIAAVGDTVNSEISMIAGKAPYYLIFDENGVLLKSIKNPGQSSRRNASSIVVNLLLKESCKTVIAGKFGDKLKNQLKTNNIECYEREGIVKTVIQTLELPNPAGSGDGKKTAAPALTSTLGGHSTYGQIKTSKSL